MLRHNTPQPLTPDEIHRLRGVADPVTVAEVEDIYLPLSRLISMYVHATQQLRTTFGSFVGASGSLAELQVPFVVGIAGSVAVGKSTTARVLRELIARWPNTPRVALVTTDGFLLPNVELQRRNILHRKGFPESYDQRGLLRFVSAIKSGVPVVHAPVYSHVTYDIVPEERITVTGPDVLILEGLNVLQPARTQSDGRSGLAVSDFFDFSIYVHARTRDIRAWYIERFLRLRQTAFARPDSYFNRYAELTDAQAQAQASTLWHNINEPNLQENIAPTRQRAQVMLTKDSDHSVQHVRLRRM